MSLTIPRTMQERIQKELSALPVVHGKVVLTFEFNVSMERVGSLKILKSTQEEIRP